MIIQKKKDHSTQRCRTCGELFLARGHQKRCAGCAEKFAHKAVAKRPVGFHVKHTCKTCRTEFEAPPRRKHCDVCRASTPTVFLKPQKKTTRKACMCCKASFMSEGAHHRMCERCRRFTNNYCAVVQAARSGHSGAL